MNDVPKIVRPEPLGKPTNRIERIRNTLGLMVCKDDYLAESGLLAPGIYGQKDAREFLDALMALGSNDEIQAWIDANPLSPAPDPVAQSRHV